jgi:hypothetical protein
MAYVPNPNFFELTAIAKAVRQLTFEMYYAREKQR